MPESTVPVAALRAGWDLVLTLGDRSETDADTAAAGQRVQRAVQAADHGEISTDDIWRGLVWLVESLSSVVMSPSHPARVDAGPEEIIDAVLEKLEKVPSLSRAFERHYPSVEEAMGCAISGKDAVLTRDADVPHFGPVDEEEAALLGHAAWYIADLNDALSGIPHLTARLMSEALDELEHGHQE
ncbi:hypothetical protein [Streptomyces klenkii]|uniref:hypothetical protein n=1 Tax=Streptomyces klenkii TaxID=1420899 RepID=UPI00341CF5BC